MDKLVFSEKLIAVSSFAVSTIAQVAIATFAAKTALTYGSSVITRAKHILATNGKVWNDSTHTKFTFNK